MNPELEPLSQSGIAPRAKREIRQLVNELVDNLIAKYDEASDVLLDPFQERQKKGQGTIRPYLFTLLPQVARASTIERSFTTSMGLVLQKCAVAVAQGAGLESEQEKKINDGRITSEAQNYIYRLCQENRPSDPVPNIAEELSVLQTLNAHQNKMNLDVTLDVYIKADNTEYYFDLKTASPNSAQPFIMKRKLLEVQTLRISEGIPVRGFGVFHYNPKGFAVKTSLGRRWFDYPNGEVLVGQEFWTFIAGPGTFQSLLDIWGGVSRQRRRDLRRIIGF